MQKFLPRSQQALDRRFARLAHQHVVMLRIRPGGRGPAITPRAVLRLRRGEQGREIRPARHEEVELMPLVEADYGNIFSLKFHGATSEPAQLRELRRDPGREW